MIANTTDHLQALRKGAADVLERHRKGLVRGGFGQREECVFCYGDYPCDAVNLTRQMTTLLDGLATVVDLLNSRHNNRAYSLDQREAYLITVCIIESAFTSAAQEVENEGR